jgi:translin
MDYPDAITNGLRRQTDVARGIIEKTRGDVTFSLRSDHLTRAIHQLGRQLNGDDEDKDDDADDGVKLPRNDEDD